MRLPNDEGSQFSKLHFPCNKEERLVLNSFFREYNLYLKKKKKNKKKNKKTTTTTFNLFKVAYHPVSCLLHLHTVTSKNDYKTWPYRMLIIGPSESGKTNALLNLIQEDNGNFVDKIYLYAKDLEEPKYHFLVKKREILE